MTTPTTPTPSSENAANSADDSTTGQSQDPTWDFESIPGTLKAAKQWNLCYHTGQVDPRGNEVKTAKRPMGGPKNPLSFMSFTQLQDKIDPKIHPKQTLPQHFGFCITPTDNLVCLDVDHLQPDFGPEHLPSTIRKMLERTPTYAEVSPSGQGLHVYYLTDKDYLAHRKDQDKSTKGFEGSVFLRNQFVTVTGHRWNHPEAAHLTLPTIAEAYAEDLEETVLHTQSLPTRTGPLSGQSAKARGLASPKYKIADIERWLSRIPPNLSQNALQPAICAAYAEFSPPITDPEDYMHWQYMAAAVHRASADINAVGQGEDLFVDWSLQGDNDGESSIRQKYRDNAPNYDDGDLTHLTLVRLATSVKPVWPYPKMKMVQGQPEPTDQPDTNNIYNWEALLSLYDIGLQQNEITKDYRVTAPKQTKLKYFDKLYNEQDAIRYDLMYFAQGNAMEKAKSTEALSATKWWVNQGATQFNPVKDWIDEAQLLHPLPQPPPGQSPDISWFQTLWETLELHPHDLPNEPLFRSYMKKNLMGIIRAHYYTGQYSDTTGIVILQGGESTRKSTWVNQLLPRTLQEYIFPSQAELTKNAKEVSLEAGICQIWLKDEVEAFISGSKFMKNADGALKSFLIQSHDAYRPLFGTKPVKARRKCIFFGTTNEQELELSSTGNRRIQVIPIKYCDTTAQAKIPMVKVYQELLDEFLDTPAHLQPKLWKLAKDEEQLTNELNYSERSLQSGGDINLQDVFDFEQPFDLTPYRKGGDSATADMIVYSKLWLLKDISKEILNKTGERAHPAALKHALKRQVGRWSGTTKDFIEPYPGWTVEYGQIKYRTNGKVKKSGYVMPPLVNNVFPEGTKKELE